MTVEIESRDSLDVARKARRPQEGHVFYPTAVRPHFISVEQIRRGCCSLSFVARGLYVFTEAGRWKRLHLESRCTDLYENITVSYRCRVARSCPSLPFSRLIFLPSSYLSTHVTSLLSYSSKRSSPR